MMNFHPLKSLLCFSAALFMTCVAIGQRNEGWKTSFSIEQAFIENKSQFDGRDMLPGSEVLFATDNGPCQVLFTKNGLTYRFDKKVNRNDEETENASQQEHDKFSWQTEVTHMQWRNANSNAQLVAEDVLPDYYNYSIGNKGLDHVKAYKKLVYKDLYPAIDVEYVFHPSGGIEYTVILHPGADASLLKMVYSGSASPELKTDLHYPTVFGDITEKAPVSFYGGQPMAFIASSFELSDKRVVSFNLGPYDHSKELIIDPLVVFPDTLPNSNKAFYIKADSAGNAYVYGGDSPFRLRKYNSAGVLQWSYNTRWDSSSYWAGALTVDPAGNSYITAGSIARIAKINPTGSFVWIGDSTSYSSLDEYWAPAFSNDYSHLFVGGTRLGQGAGPLASAHGVTQEIALASGNASRILNCADYYADTIVVGSFTFPQSYPNEVRTLCSSPNGNMYFLSMDSIGAFDTAFHVLYRHRSSYTYQYFPSFGLGFGQGQNAMAVSGNYIYTSNGTTLFRRFILTGDILDSVPIPHGLAELNYGVAVDSCENVYVGSQGHVYKYDNTFSLADSAGVSAAVYDVTIGPNGTVYACGNNFAAAVYLNACSSHLTVAPTGVVVSLSAGNSCAGACSGSLTVTPVTGTPPFKYIWNYNADTTQTITGLCRGSYTVTVTDLLNYTCTATGVVGQTPTPLQQLCMVTADSNSTENMVVWEKADKYATDSFFLYRANTPDTSYVLIAGANRDSLSEYNDASANPDLMSYRYKINLKDTCAAYSALSNYHQTIFLTDSTQGNFNWVPYEIENTTNPVTGYSLYRDSISSGNWQLVVSVAGNQTTAADPNYALYFNARYKVVATLSGNCTASRSAGSLITSNIVTLLSTGLTNSVDGGNIAIFPNPGKGLFTLQTSGLLYRSYVVYDVLGNRVAGNVITSNRQMIDLNTAAPGIYLLTVKAENISKTLRVTIAR